MFEDTSDNSHIIRMCAVRNYVHNVTAISFFVSFLDFTTVCLLIIGVDVMVVNDQTQTHTYTLGKTRLDEWSACHGDLYLTTHNTQDRQTSTTPVEFEPTIRPSQLPQTHALGRAATGIG